MRGFKVNLEWFQSVKPMQLHCNNTNKFLFCLLLVRGEIPFVIYFDLCSELCHSWGMWDESLEFEV